MLAGYCKSLLHEIKRNRAFTVVMAEALNNLEQMENEQKEEKKAATESVRSIKNLKKNLKRREWQYFKHDEATTSDVTDSKRLNFDPAERIKRRKTAILLGYSGANYFGMQRNPGMVTIEEELFKVMLKHKWITEDGFEQAQISCFQRAARTDKGVSAARQVCSIKIPNEHNIEALNADLPEDIRVFASERVTKGFNAKEQCNARTYTYTLPTIAFAPCSEENNIENYRITDDILQKVHDVITLYEGTQNFHNFTSRKYYIDPSAKRFIMSFSCSKPLLSPQNIEFVTIKVKGQSFMMHQIRKMVGLAIAIVRGNTDVVTLESAFSEERLDLPMAPGLGLVLDTVHYERYDKRYSNDGIHKPLTWDAQEQQISEFAEKYIYAKIFKIEHEERSMLKWLETLSRHSYEARKDENTAIKADETEINNKADINEE